MNKDRRRTLAVGLLIGVIVLGSIAWLGFDLFYERVHAPEVVPVGIDPTDIAHAGYNTRSGWPLSYRRIPITDLRPGPPGTWNVPALIVDVSLPVIVGAAAILIVRRRSRRTSV